MAYKDPIKLIEHKRLRQRKLRLREEINEQERLKCRERYQENPEKYKEYREAYNKKYSDRYRARYILNNAIKRGIIKKEPCSICGASVNVQGHHKDYNYPLDVEWLCIKCHMRKDKWIPLTMSFPMAQKFPELLP